MDRLIQTVGGVALGDRFWDRETELRLFMQRIDEGSHLLLTAQRRMGKTSLLREAASRLSGQYVCLFIDLQKARSAPDVVVEISLAMHPHKPFWDKAKGVFDNILNKITGVVDKIEAGELGIKLRAGLTAGDWNAKGNRLFSILAESQKPVVLMLDELPIVASRILKGDDICITPEGAAHLDAFMSWLRQNTLNHQSKIRVVLCGSIGLEPILHQARLSATINHFTPFELGPWDGQTSVAALHALANQYDIEFIDGAESEMVARLGCCIPHHVQMFFMHVQAACAKRGAKRAAPADIQQIYQNEMLGVRGHAELTTYEDRLKLILGGEMLSLATELLTEAAVTSCLTRGALAALQKDYTFDSCTVVQAQQAILEVLQHDGYLACRTEGYVFVSHLLRDWWKNRYGCFYIPVLKRKG